MFSVVNYPDVQAQVLIIGTGIAGLFTALKLADAGISVCLVTKTSLAESNSRYAQGGIAAVLPHNLEDSIDLHVADTLRAGAGLCDEPAVKAILTEGAEAIADLLAYGVPFDRTSQDELALTQEAAHSVRRIIHAGGDATGQSVELSLINQVNAKPNITVVEHCAIVELWVTNGCCHGAWGWREGHVLGFSAQHVILATGGAGQLYKSTTNPPIATGDGIYLAKQAGAKLRDLEFVQFHPTAFYDSEARQVRFLISEALRGEGAVLLNHQGERFAQSYHPQGELAPRDVVTRAIFAEQQRTHQSHVWLDIHHQPKALIESRFPNILRLCMAEGLDIRKDPIPVSPAAHYLMGGVAVTVDGCTRVDRLYAVGEVACTGLHGANRLASNSLLECVVLARRAAAHIVRLAAGSTFLPAPADKPVFMPDKPEGQREAERFRQQVQQLMWDSVGIVRETEALKQAASQLTIWLHQPFIQSDKLPDRSAGITMGAWQSRQLLHLAFWVTQAALKRTVSVGAHYRVNRSSGSPVALSASNPPAISLLSTPPFTGVSC